MAFQRVVYLILFIVLLVFPATLAEEVLPEVPPPETSPQPIPLSITITANPLSGTVPLAVQFISAVAGKQPLTYSWDFNNDGLPDNTNQNPSFTFEHAGTYNITLSVTDAEGNSGSQSITITGTEYDSGLNLSSYFPASVTKGQNQITFLIINNGKESLHDLSAKIIADGVQQTSATTITLLRPGDQDSLTIGAVFLKIGELNGVLKVEEKNIPLTFTVKEAVSYNTTELQASFQQVKRALKEQEAVYADKKANDFLVTEIYDAIKTAQKQVQDAQQQLLTNKYADAKLAIDLANTTISDVTQSLQNAKKQKQSPLIWLKDNAVALTAIVAASGTISGILIKVKNKASKLSENVKLKMNNSPARKKEEDIVNIEKEKKELEKADEKKDDKSSMN
ncbi:PKD domain-containing protein [Candidatus Woesearchaeota archaeon]|nr:PKD domain-containing protein [Candidatus Woesearchaeota archaeon]